MEASLRPNGVRNRFQKTRASKLFDVRKAVTSVEV